MLLISAMKDIHVGLPGVVLGGGPSLADDLAQVPTGSILISANQHGLRQARCDYLAFMDNPAQIVELGEAVRAYDGVKISRQDAWTDVRLDVPWWADCRLTGPFATWVACWLGCSPVILCGMDCYQGGRMYSDDYPVDVLDPVFHWGLEKHLALWRGAFERCENPESIKAMSGPLVEIFGKY